MAVMVTYVIISYFVAYTCKVADVKSKWLPVIAAFTGLICGVTGYFMFGANGDLMDAIATGLFSGFSATGTNEIAKYLFVRKD